MFAPKVAGPTGKAAATLVPRQSGRVQDRPRHHPAGSVRGREYEQTIAPEVVTASDRAVWNVGTLPVFPPDRTDRPSPPSHTRARLPEIIQPKLAIGRVDDPSEHEADRVADQVMGMSEPGAPLASRVPQVSRKCAACEEEEANMLQPKPLGPAGAAAGEAPASVHDALRSPGRPLDSDTLGFMERRFERDFRHVRIHTDEAAAESAQAIDALAYTVGDRIVFGPGRYVPRTAEGRRLIAHELTHTIQQGAVGRRSPGDGSGPQIASDATGVVQRADCTGKSYRTCFGKCTHPISGKAGTCMWSGLTYGCRCQENPTLEGVKQVLYDLIIAALIAAGIVLTAAAIVAIIACLSGPCEIAALIAAVGFAAAMIIIGIIRGGSGTPGAAPTPVAATASSPEGGEAA
jgi:hypothetical protein